MSLPRWPAPASPTFVRSTGIDGALALNGTSTILGMSPATVGSFKVYTMTRDIFPLSMTLSANVIVFTANFRIFCQGAITGAGNTSSLIHNNGKDAATSISGTIYPGVATPSGTFILTRAGNTWSSSLPPVPFGTTTIGGLAGVASTGAATNGAAPTGPFAGGGGGATSQTGGGGTNGQVAQGANVITTVGVNYDPIAQMFGFVPLGATTQFTFGAGGGAGSSTAVGTGGTTITEGGGGGAGGGCCFVACAITSNIGYSTNGGAGAQGFLGSQGTTGAAAAGGGGGGAGILIVHYTSQSGCTFLATGGIGATGLQRGTGITSNGGNGGPGLTLLYNYSGDGT